MGCRVWDNTAARLQDAGHGVVVYDHRCCGASDKDFADVSVAALGGDLVRLCEHLQLERPVLNGWSLGGAIVVDAAARLGGNLGGLVLTGAATPRYTQAEDFPPRRSDGGRGRHGGRLASGPGEFFAGAVFRWCLRPGSRRGGQGLVLAHRPAGQPGRGRLLGRLSPAGPTGGHGSSDLPALVAVGVEDGVVSPGISRDAAQRLSQAELLEFKGCGHAVFLEDPERYHSALLNILGGIDS